jgi:hypothetical protein
MSNQSASRHDLLTVVHGGTTTDASNNNNNNNSNHSVATRKLSGPADIVTASSEVRLADSNHQPDDFTNSKRESGDSNDSSHGDRVPLSGNNTELETLASLTCSSNMVFQIDDVNPEDGDIAETSAASDSDKRHSTTLQPDSEKSGDGSMSENDAMVTRGDKMAVRVSSRSDLSQSSAKIGDDGPIGSEREGGGLSAKEVDGPSDKRAKEKVASEIASNAISGSTGTHSKAIAMDTNIRMPLMLLFFLLSLSLLVVAAAAAAVVVVVVAVVVAAAAVVVVVVVVAVVVVVVVVVVCADLLLIVFRDIFLTHRLPSSVQLLRHLPGHLLECGVVLQIPGDAERWHHTRVRLSLKSVFYFLLPLFFHFPPFLLAVDRVYSLAHRSPQGLQRSRPRRRAATVRLRQQVWFISKTSCLFVCFLFEYSIYRVELEAPKNDKNSFRYFQHSNMHNIFGSILAPNAYLGGECGFGLLKYVRQSMQLMFVRSFVFFSRFFLFVSSSRSLMDVAPDLLADERTHCHRQGFPRGSKLFNFYFILLIDFDFDYDFFFFAIEMHFCCSFCVEELLFDLSFCEFESILLTC